MRKGKHRGREMKEGEAGRGEHGVMGGRECWREGRRREGGREIRARQAGGQEGTRGELRGRETPMLSARHGYAQKHVSGC